MSRQQKVRPELAVAPVIESHGDDPTAEPGTDRQAPDPEVVEKPTRRTFTAEYKARILRLAENCAEGEVGALLRREGLYSSHLSKWRKQRDKGALAGLEPQTRGRKPAPRNELAQENERLRRHNEKLTEQLRKAHVIIDVQKKVALLLGTVTEPTEEPS